MGVKHVIENLNRRLEFGLVYNDDGDGLLLELSEKSSSYYEKSAPYNKTCMLFSRKELGVLIFTLTGMKEELDATYRLDQMSKFSSYREEKPEEVLND